MDSAGSVMRKDVSFIPRIFRLTWRFSTFPPTDSTAAVSFLAIPFLSGVKSLTLTWIKRGSLFLTL